MSRFECKGTGQSHPIEVDMSHADHAIIASLSETDLHQIAYHLRIDHTSLFPLWYPNGLNPCYKTESIRGSNSFRVTSVLDF